MGLDDIPSRGKTAVEMFDAVRRGEIKILWIVCTNPAQSMPDQQPIREALERAELVIVQEAYRGTATMAYADVVFLPRHGRKVGHRDEFRKTHFTCTGGHLTDGAAKPDWEIAKNVALQFG